jgi:hypothetical protein
MNKTKNILLMYAGTPVDRLPEEIRSQVEGDPGLRAQLDAQAEMADLMKLKSYERPDAALEGRVRHRVGVRLRNGDHLRSPSRLDALPDWARMVAVVVVMFGLSLLTHREMLEDPEMETDLQTAAQAEPLSPVSTSTHTEPYIFHEDSFSSVVLNLNPDNTPWELTHDRRLKIEESLLELGLTEPERNPNTDWLPVMLPAP